MDEFKMGEPIVRPSTEEEKMYYESGKWKKWTKLEDWKPKDEQQCQS